jgi:hypothetical protein
MSRRLGSEAPANPGASDAEMPNEQDFLDRDDPGKWVIRRHRDNLVVRLIEPKEGLVKSGLTTLKTKIQEIRDGKIHSTSPPLGDGESQVTSPHADNRRFRINFAEVQRMYVRKLQCQLVRHVAKMRATDQESSGWEETLAKYSTLESYCPLTVTSATRGNTTMNTVKALQDHDYMEKRSLSSRDPFLATGEYFLDNCVLNTNIDEPLAGDIAYGVSSRGHWEGNDPGQVYTSICGDRGTNILTLRRRGLRDRVLLAVIGGAFLIGPMWLTVLQGGRYTSLISTTSFVTGFGIFMVWLLSEAKDVLASTAAYAAVLVVFVGTNTPNPTE